MRIVLGIMLLFGMGCSSDVSSFVEIPLNELFNYNEVSTYTFRSYPDRTELYVNGKYEREMKLQVHTVYDSIHLEIPNEFKYAKEQDGSNLNHFETDSNTDFYLQILQDPTSSAFAFFNNVYKNGITSGYTFDLESGNFFDCGSVNFVSYSLSMAQNKGDSQYVLGLILNSQFGQFYDISLIQDSPFDPIDYIVFTEIVHSIKANKSPIIPYSSSIKKVVELTLD